MKSTNQKAIQTALRSDSNALYLILDDMRGSYAVIHILEELVRPGNTHTIHSVLELLKKRK